MCGGNGPVHGELLLHPLGRQRPGRLGLAWAGRAAGPPHSAASGSTHTLLHPLLSTPGWRGAQTRIPGTQGTPRGRRQDKEHGACPRPEAGGVSLGQRPRTSKFCLPHLDPLRGLHSPLAGWGGLGGWLRPLPAGAPTSPSLLGGCRRVGWRQTPDPRCPVITRCVQTTLYLAPPTHALCLHGARSSSLPGISVPSE